MPDALAELLSADWGEIDFQPRTEFMSPDEASECLVAWQHREDFDSSPFLVFGADGSGGLAAIWRVDPAGALLDQPIVQLDVEHEDYVVAVDFSEFLWLVAAGIGPFEANDDYAHPPSPAIQALAQKHAPNVTRRGFEIVEHAQAVHQLP